MYQYVRAAGEGSSLGWTIATIYFTLTMVIGNFTLLALFTALLLKNFDRVEDEDDEEKQKLEASQLAQKLELEELEYSKEGKEKSELEICMKSCCSCKVWAARYKRMKESFIDCFGDEQEV